MDSFVWFWWCLIAWPIGKNKNYEKRQGSKGSTQDNVHGVQKNETFVINLDNYKKAVTDRVSIYRYHSSLISPTSQPHAWRSTESFR